MPNSAHARFSRAPPWQASRISPTAWRRSGALILRPRLPPRSPGLFFAAPTAPPPPPRPFPYAVAPPPAPESAACSLAPQRAEESAAPPSLARSQTKRQAWTSSGYTPRLRQYSPSCASFRAAVSTTIANFSSLRQRSAVFASGAEANPRSRHAWHRQPYQVSRGIPVSRDNLGTLVFSSSSIRSTRLAFSSSE